MTNTSRKTRRQESGKPAWTTDSCRRAPNSGNQTPIASTRIMSTSSTERRSLFRRKPVEAFVTETGPDAEGGELERSIGLFQLTMFGVGATIGTGIFIVLTEAVPEAGPAVILSFVLAGITAALTAVCYAELASTIPVSGSSYSYTYATMGEIT